jgi:methyl-accepting chemotaxis protein
MEEEIAADFAALDKAIREIERQAGHLGEIEASSQTIRSGAEKILKRVESMRTALQKQIETLDEQSRALRELAGGSPNET